MSNSKVDSSKYFIGRFLSVTKELYKRFRFPPPFTDSDIRERLTKRVKV